MRKFVTLSGALALAALLLNAPAYAAGGPPPGAGGGGGGGGGGVRAPAPPPPVTLLPNPIVTSGGLIIGFIRQHGTSIPVIAPGVPAPFGP